jgi:anti-sigma regulatory factor (Ser/Thr protein kinase)
MRLVFDLTVSTSAPYEARAVVDSLEQDLVPETLGDLRMVISELVANAVKYGPGSPIHVELEVVAPDRVHGEVADRGDPDRAPRVVERPGSEGGFGLRIVDALATAWGVHEGSTHVWFALGD